MVNPVKLYGPLLVQQLTQVSKHLVMMGFGLPIKQRTLIRRILLIPNTTLRVPAKFGICMETATLRTVVINAARIVMYVTVITVSTQFLNRGLEGKRQALVVIFSILYPRMARLTAYALIMSLGK